MNIFRDTASPSPNHRMNRLIQQLSRITIRKNDILSKCTDASKNNATIAKLKKLLIVETYIGMTQSEFHTDQQKYVSTFGQEQNQSEVFLYKVFEKAFGKNRGLCLQILSSNWALPTKDGFLTPFFDLHVAYIRAVDRRNIELVVFLTDHTARVSGQFGDNIDAVWEEFDIGDKINAVWEEFESSNCEQIGDRYYSVTHNYDLESSVMFLYVLYKFDVVLHARYNYDPDDTVNVVRFDTRMNEERYKLNVAMDLMERHYDPSPVVRRLIKMLYRTISTTFLSLLESRLESTVAHYRFKGLGPGFRKPRLHHDPLNRLINRNVKRRQELHKALKKVYKKSLKNKLRL